MDVVVESRKREKAVRYYAVTPGQAPRPRPTTPAPGNGKGKGNSVDTETNQSTGADGPSDKPRIVTAKHPHHVWHLDHTVLPTAAGFWVPWVPWCAGLCWPFCWWLTVILDHFSRKVVASSIFTKQPSEEDVCRLLDRAAAGTAGALSGCRLPR